MFFWILQKHEITNTILQQEFSKIIFLYMPLIVFFPTIFQKSKVGPEIASTS